MVDRKGTEGLVYVTLVQASEYVDGTPEQIRRAINNDVVRAVRENPANKRSRWLVSLDDVKREFGELEREEEPVEAAREPIQHRTVEPNGEVGARAQTVQAAVPSPAMGGLDVQSLLDRYVDALEKATSAQLERATVQRRLDAVQEALAETRQELAEAHAQTRQLLVELEMARAEADRTRDDLAEERTRPLWKRRKHPMPEQ